MLLIISLFLFFCLNISLFVILFIYLKNKNKNKFIYDIIVNFPSYYAVLEFFMDKAFLIIQKDRLLIYSIEGLKITEEMFATTNNDFCKLTLKLMGPELQKHFEILYGGIHALLLNISYYFNDRYENDKIREASQKEIMDKDYLGETS